MSAIVEHSDCRAYLATLATNSLDACTTDPPYELNFMGRGWDRSGIANHVKLWREVYRVLKPGAHLVAFGGTRTYHRMVCAIEDAGFEIRDTLQWIYGSGFNKSRNVLKPAHEPIVLARKPIAKTVAATIAAYGTGGINVEACRVSTNGEHITAGTSGSVRRGTFHEHEGYNRPWKQRDPELQASRMDAAIERTNLLGRWPPNLLLSHSPACNGHCAPDCAVAALDRQSGERTSVRSARGGASGNKVYGKFAEATGYECGYTDTGGASRFYPILNYDPVYDDPFLYCAKASRAERNQGLGGMPERVAGNVNQFMNGTRSNWIKDDRHPNGGYVMAPPQANANHHPTVKPVALCRWLVRLVVPLGGTALDPFAGSGSFGVACVLEGRHYKGCDQDAEYVEIANRRIVATQPALIGV